jgi:hypothetical protein
VSEDATQSVEMPVPTPSVGTRRMPVPNEEMKNPKVVFHSRFPVPCSLFIIAFSLGGSTPLP